MATLSTASSYISKVNENYPIAGQDNNTQGFRDNFKNLKISLNYLDEDLYEVKLNAVVASNPLTNFSGNTLENIVLKNQRVEIFEEQGTNYNINYQNGNFQKFSVSNSTHIFSISSAPNVGEISKVDVVITPSSGNANISFSVSSGNIFNYSGLTFPLNLTSTRLFSLLIEKTDTNTINLYIK